MAMLIFVWTLRRSLNICADGIYIIVIWFLLEFSIFNALRMGIRKWGCEGILCIWVYGAWDLLMGLLQ